MQIDRTRSLVVRLPILLYHWFADEFAPPSRSPELGISPGRFKAHIDLLLTGGWRAMSLPEIVTSLETGKALPRKAFAISFDDAYADFMDHACELVESARVPVTLFAVADLVGKTNSWDRDRGEPRRPLLDWHQIRELSDQGVSIGSHSCTHRDLTGLTSSELEYECRGSRQMLEDGIGRSVRLFAYPYGRHDRRVRACVAESGYAAGFAVLLSPRDISRSSRFALMRVTVHGTKSLSNLRWRLRLAAPMHRRT
jgi:peptidoglycan/xylan/chitin deacetylase (PgdA/CDA1 family)